VIFQGIKQSEGFKIESAPTIRCDHPIMSADGEAIWDRSEGWFWVTAEPDEETFYLSVEAAGPRPGWMQYIEDTEGIGYALFPDALDGAELATALLALGVAPFQPFFVHMTFEYHRGDGWETDDEQDTDWELLDRAKLDPAIAAKRWANWLAEWRNDPEETP
jgi:hypothetical protein